MEDLELDILEDRSSVMAAGPVGTSEVAAEPFRNLQTNLTLSNQES
jgi:hypothetical protein